MLMARQRAAELGQETLRILQAGRYEGPAGVPVDIRALLDHAVEGTRSYPPDYRFSRVPCGGRETRSEVANETTLVAARRLADEKAQVVALNFASAKHPGGGFLSGARAQEESLARSSGLYACLSGNAMYGFHQARRDAMYTNYAIYSPDVPVIRTDDGTLLSTPWLCSFITSPAVNANVVLARDRSRRGEIGAAMRDRIHKVLAVAHHHDHDALVLGAWGCGAFGNDAREIAELFHKALHSEFRGVFDRIVFAITDWSQDRRFIGPFWDVFGRQEGSSV